MATGEGIYLEAMDHETRREKRKAVTVCCFLSPAASLTSLNGLSVAHSEVTGDKKERSEQRTK